MDGDTGGGVVTFGDLQLEISGRAVHLGLKGRPRLATGTASLVIEALEEGFADIDHPRGVVDGLPVRGIYAFPETDTELAAGRDGSRLVLVWRDQFGRVVARGYLSERDFDEMKEWLDRATKKLDRN